MTVTTQSYRGYVLTISCVPEEPGYTVDFPDIAEIITSHATLPGAFANACEALDLYLDSLDRLGRPYPTPRHRLVLEAV